MRRSLLSSASLLSFSALLLLGCAVGPDFVAPASPDVTAYDSTPPSAQTADGAQALQMGQDIPAEWWQLFHSDTLNQLIAQGLKDNPDLASADAALRVANDELGAGESELFPVISGSFSSQRQKVAGASYGGDFPSTIYTLHNASVSVSYGIDLFGGTRRMIEGLQAQADMARFQREAAYLTLTSNIVTTAIGEASLHDQIQAAQEIISAQEKILKILQARFESGAVPKSAVLEQETTLATSQSYLPPLDHQLAVTRHQLSVLIGQMPNQELSAKFLLKDMTLPTTVPLSVPSQLVEQRPDIRMAEENLHAASAQIGVAVAARLPEITLSADIGSVANKLSKLFTPGGGFWSLGGSAAETLFDAGALADQEDAARDSYDQAAAQYRKTVLAAFQNVADTLHALQSDAELLNARAQANHAAADGLSLTQTQFQAGSVGMADLLNAQQLYQQAQSALVQVKAQRYADTAALFAALGGGWWNRDTATIKVKEKP